MMVETSQSRKHRSSEQALSERAFHRIGQWRDTVLAVKT